MLKALRPARLLMAAAIVAVAAVAFAVIHRTDEYLEVPDEAHPLAGLVSVPGGNKEPKDGGGIYYVDVLIKRASLLESLVPALRPDGSDVIQREQLVPAGNLRPGADQARARRHEAVAGGRLDGRSAPARLQGARAARRPARGRRHRRLTCRAASSSPAT